jgi:Tfp pilus assembly protein PilX
MTQDINRLLRELKEAERYVREEETALRQAEIRLKNACAMLRDRKERFAAADKPASD